VISPGNQRVSESAFVFFELDWRSLSSDWSPNFKAEIEYKIRLNIINPLTQIQPKEKHDRDERDSPVVLAIVHRKHEDAGRAVADLVLLEHNAWDG
jgi:hypothetical protein